MSPKLKWIAVFTTSLVLPSALWPVHDQVEQKGISAGQLTPFHSVTFCPNGKLLAVAELDGKVRMSSIGTRSSFLLHESDGTVGMEFSPDGRVLATVDGDNVVKLWEVASGKWRATLKGNKSFTAFSCCAFSPDGKWLATGGHDQVFKVWDLKTGAIKYEIKNGDGGAVFALALNSAGTLIAIGNGNQTVKLYDVSIGKLAGTFKGHSSYVWSVAFSEDGNTLASASASGEVMLWNVKDGTVRVIQKEQPKYTRSVAFSSDGKWLAWDEGCSVTLWDVKAGKERLRLVGHTEDIYTIAFNADCTVLASAGYSGAVLLWHLPRT